MTHEPEPRRAAGVAFFRHGNLRSELLQETCRARTGEKYEVNYAQGGTQPIYTGCCRNRRCIIVSLEEDDKRTRQLAMFAIILAGLLVGTLVGRFISQQASRPVAPAVDAEKTDSS